MRYLSLIFFLACPGSVLAAACIMPKAPAIIDGRTANKEQMLNTQNAVKEFLAENEKYRGCLNDQLESLDETVPQKRKAALAETINETYDMEYLVGDTFNTQVRIYKTVNQ